jgi:small subunit ribosomal protein S27Ae
MQFFVKSLTGTFAVNAQSGDNINNVKAMIQEREGTFFISSAGTFKDLD